MLRLARFLAVISLLLPAALPVSAAVHDVEVANFAFTPAGVTISPGDTVRWTLVSGTHTVTSDQTSPKSWDSGTMATVGQVFEVAFPASDGTGPFPYHCNFHVTMMGTVYVALPPDTVGVFGLTHTSLGAASIAVHDGRLVMTGLGSTGADGVLIHTRNAEGIGPIRWMAPEAIQSSVNLDYGDETGVDIGRCVLTRDGGTGTVGVDFSALGVSSYTIQIIQTSGGAVDNPLYEDDNASGVNPFYEESARAAGDTVVVIGGVPQGGGAVTVVLGHAVDWDLGDGGGFHTGDMIRFIPNQTPSTVAGVSSIAFTASHPDSVVILAEHLESNGVPVGALGQAVLEATVDGMSVSNIGSSGVDGVSLGAPTDLPDLWSSSGLGWQVGPVDPGLAGGASIDILVRGHAEGIVHRDLAARNILLTATGWESGFDFSPIGSSAQLMQVYHGDTLVAEANDVSNMQKARHDAMMAAIQNSKGSVIAESDWDSPTMITLPGQAPVMCVTCSRPNSWATDWW